MKNILVILAFLALPGLAQGQEFGHEPQCDARIIAKHKPKLTEQKWTEVIDNAEIIGQITPRWANELRGLINEAYLTDDVPAWVASKCE